MNKNVKRYFIVIAILAITYTILAFVIPFPKKNYATFIISYVAVMIAFASQYYVAFVALKNDGVKSKFYGIPILRVGYIYLIAQFIVSTALMITNAFVDVPYWIIICVLVVLLAASAIGFIGTVAVKEQIETIEIKQENNTKFITNLQLEVESIPSKIDDIDLKNKTTKFAEKVRFSDPVSSKDLETLEDEIDRKYLLFKENALNQNNAQASIYLDELNDLLDERNKRTKMMKK